MTVVYFDGGPWDGKSTDVDRVVGPLFALGDDVGSHYWLDPNSDPPTYHWEADLVEKIKEGMRLQ
jgi:hypothetical protein